MRRLVERLGDLLGAKVDRGPKELDLSCQVCSFHLKAQKVVTQAHNLVSGLENNMVSKKAILDMPSRLGVGQIMGSGVGCMRRGEACIQFSHFLIPLQLFFS